jgi:hypothetical protein
MAISLVLFQAAATIIAGQIQARTVKNVSAITAIAKALTQEVSVYRNVVKTYQELRRAVQVIEEADAANQKEAGSPKSQVEVFGPTV